MPRAIWSGSISFGLVNIPIKLYSAVSRKSVHFNQIDATTKARVKQKLVSAEDGSEVSRDQLLKGYELSSGNFVLVNEEELAALDPLAQRTIDIDEFVDLSEIDPIFFDNAYYLAPDQATIKPYALLAEAMERSQKVGVAHFVMRSKQYMAAVRPKDGRLLLSTMVYADEINDPAEIPELDAVADFEVSDKELEMAQQLIESLAADFEPGKYRDTYREAVLNLIERKASGVEEIVTASAAASPEKVVDLMAALEASVKAAKEARGRHPTALDAEDEADKAELSNGSGKKKVAAKAAKAPRKRKSA